MEAARRLAFAALLILPAALALGLASCSDRTAPGIPVAEAAPLPPPPAAPAPEAAKPAPAEPEQKPTPAELAEFQKPAPK